IHQNLALIAVEKPQNAAENGALPRAVAAQQADDLSGSRLKARLLEHGFHAVPKGNILYIQDHFAFSFFSRRYMKNGAPRNAVRIPTGMSMVEMLLAILSTKSINPAPSRREAGIRYLWS